MRRNNLEASFWIYPEEGGYDTGDIENHIGYSWLESSKYVTLKVGISGCNATWFIHGSNKEILDTCNSVVKKLNASLRDLKKEVKRLENKNESGQEDKRSSEV